MTRPHLPPAINVARAVLSYVTPDGVQQNTYHMYFADGWDESSLASCASGFINWETASASVLRSDQVSLVQVVLTDLTTPDGALYAVTPSPPVQGQNTKERVPSNVTFAVCFTTGKRGSGRQGRQFWIGLTRDMVEGDQIGVSFAEDIRSSFEQLLIYITSAVHCQLVVLHRTRDGVTLDPAEYSPIGNWVFRDYYTDSQTMRLPGRSRSHKPRV